MFAPSVGTMMDGEHAFATSGGTAWRRRQRRLRAFRRYVLWHSKIEIAAALHHTSRQRTATIEAATQTMSYAPGPADACYTATGMTNSIAEFLEPLVPVIEYVAPTPDVTYTEPDPVIEHATLAPVDVYTTPAPVIELMRAPVIGTSHHLLQYLILRFFLHLTRLMKPSPVW